MQIVLQQIGAYLHKKGEAFEVRTADGSHKISPARIDSILISPGVKISSDALLFAIKKQIEVILLDGKGSPMGRIWSHQYGSISSIRKQQVHFGEGKSGAMWITGLIARRITTQRDLLLSLARDRPAKRNLIESTAQTLDSILLKVEALQPDTLDDAAKAQLRGWEGAAGQSYFSALAAVVPEEYRFERRSRRPALDIFNAVLNYLFGILYGRIEGALIKAGIDPYLGVFHRDEYNRPVLVFDMIEPYRAWAEAVLLSLCFHRALREDMFAREGRSFWLDTAGKKLIIGAMNDYLAEVVQLNGKRRSRLVHIQEDCYNLAQRMLAEAKGEDSPL